MNRTIAFSLLLILLFACPSWAANWYVKSGCGTNGDGTGSSCGSAWSSFANIQWGSIQPGDTLYIIGTFTERLAVGAAGSSGGGNITIRGDNAAGAGQVGNTSTPEYVCVNNYNTISGLTVYGNILVCDTVDQNFSQLVFIAATNEVRDYSKQFINLGFTTNDQFHCGSAGSTVQNTHIYGIASITSYPTYDSIIVNTVGAQWSMVNDSGVNYEIQKFPKITNVTVTNSKVYTTGNGWLSVLGLDGVSNLTISNTEVDGGGYAGKGAFYIDGNDSWNRPSNQTLTGNYFHDIGSTTTIDDDVHCIGVQAVNGLTITGNHLKNCAAGIVIYPGTSSVQAVLGLTITDNLIEGMNYSLNPGQWGGDGIVFTGVDQCPLCDQALVAYNIITTPLNCPASNEFNCVGIQTKWSVQNKFYNNTIVNHDISFYSGAGSGASVDWRNNISYNPTTYHMDLYPGVGTWTEDYDSYYPDTGTKFKIGGNVYNYAGYAAIHTVGAHILTSNPLFTGASSFTLQSSSPAIDKGDNTVWAGKPSIFDFAGSTGITNASGIIIAPGGVVDIGAYEYATQESALSPPTGLRILAQ
jgi:hypothetical protein